VKTGYFAPKWSWHKSSWRGAQLSTGYVLMAWHLGTGTTLLTLTWDRLHLHSLQLDLWRLQQKDRHNLITLFLPNGLCLKETQSWRT